VLRRLREEWRHFVDAAPGNRFQLLHGRKRAGRGGLARALFWWSAGFVLMVAGFVMLFTPGPGILTLALGIACIAQESLPFARRCDRFELRLRRHYSRWRSRRPPPPAG
jgi:hypothetical protein